MVDISPLARRCHCIFTSSKATNMIYLAAVLSSRSASHRILLFAMLFLLQCVAYTLANNNDQNYILATRKQKGKRMSLKKKKKNEVDGHCVPLSLFLSALGAAPGRTHERTRWLCTHIYRGESFLAIGQIANMLYLFPVCPSFSSLSLFIVGWIPFSPKRNHSSCSRDSIAQLFGFKFQENRSYLFQFHLWYKNVIGLISLNMVMSISHDSIRIWLSFTSRTPLDNCQWRPVLPGLVFFLLQTLAKKK